MSETGMTVKQFNGFMRFILDDIIEVLEKMQDSEEKQRLRRVADNLQSMLEE